MNQKETYWSRFTDDFEERNNYVVGKKDIDIMLNKLSQQKGLKNTLELGCGNGTYSKILAKEATKLYATDFSDEMVNASKSRLQSFQNITVEKANCFELPYEENTFDTVFMANLLHIIPEPEKAIVETKRVLKKEGTIIVIDYTVEGMKTFHKLGMIYRYLKTYGKPSPYAWDMKLANARDMLLKQGFNIKKSELLGNRSKAIFIRAEILK